MTFDKPSDKKGKGGTDGMGDIWDNIFKEKDPTSLNKDDSDEDNNGENKGSGDEAEGKGTGGNGDNDEEEKVNTDEYVLPDKHDWKSTNKKKYEYVPKSKV